MGWRDALVVENTDWSSQRPRFNCQHLRGDPPWFVTMSMVHGHMLAKHQYAQNK